MAEKTPRHGGPADRGSADAWYKRALNPHYFEGATYSTKLIEAKDMTSKEIEEYTEAYNVGWFDGAHKDWGDPDNN